jgi:hypothetical protein
LLCPLTEKKDKILSAHNQIDTGNLLSNILTFWNDFILSLIGGQVLSLEMLLSTQSFHSSLSDYSL